jgi:hypothetical protein
MLSRRTAVVAAVVDMAVAVVAMVEVAVVEVADFTAVAVADFVPAGAVVDTSAVDTLWPHPSRLDISLLDTSRLDSSRLDTSWLDLDPVHTSRLDIETVHTSRLDTTAISGTAVGGITALARAGYGRTITASTCGPAIKALQSPAAIGPRYPFDRITTTEPKPRMWRQDTYEGYGPGGHVASATIPVLDRTLRPSPPWAGRDAKEDRQPKGGEGCVMSRTLTG